MACGAAARRERKQEGRGGQGPAEVEPSQREAAVMTRADYYPLIELLIEGLRRTRLLPVQDSDTLPVLRRMWTEPRPTQAYCSHPYGAH